MCSNDSISSFLQLADGANADNTTPKIYNPMHIVWPAQWDTEAAKPHASAMELDVMREGEDCRADLDGFALAFIICKQMIEKWCAREIKNAMLPAPVADAEKIATHFTHIKSLSESAPEPATLETEEESHNRRIENYIRGAKLRDSIQMSPAAGRRLNNDDG